MNPTQYGYSDSPSWFGYAETTALGVGGEGHGSVLLIVLALLFLAGVVTWVLWPSNRY